MHINVTKREPPYYAVIFTSIRREGDNGYGKMAIKMVDLASRQPGYLGFETAGSDAGIFISYWKDLDAIKAWKENAEHGEAQRRATEWYRSFRVRVCRVEREYGF